jgi:hypothetical protein
MSWQTVRREPGERGTVELQRFETGKGRRKFVSWQILCEGVKVDYASVPEDVDVNFDRVMRGEFRYEPSGPCPAGDACAGTAFPGHPAHRP